MSRRTPEGTLVAGPDAHSVDLEHMRLLVRRNKGAWEWASKNAHKLGDNLFGQAIDEIEWRRDRETRLILEGQAEASRLNAELEKHHGIDAYLTRSRAEASGTEKFLREEVTALRAAHLGVLAYGHELLALADDSTPEVAAALRDTARGIFTRLGNEYDLEAADVA